jgi:DNA-binding LytR/AlgR family response regulator
MFKIAIVEDSIEDKAEIEKCITEFATKNNTKITIESFKTGLDFLDAYNSNFDVIFLDINMPHLDGLNVAKKIRQIDDEVPIAFVTSMAKCAINGYEVSAISFILKPFSYADIEIVLKKAIKIASSREKTIIIKSNGNLKRVNVSGVCYVEVQNNTVFLNMSDKSVLPIRTTLTEIESKLLEADKSFIRCNNCYLVNLKFVTDVCGDTVVVNGDKLVISRHRKKLFLDQLTSYYGNGSCN